MIALLLSIAWAGAVAYLLVRAIRQYSFYQVIRPDSRPISNGPRIDIIIPARNEELNISACLQSLLLQDYPRDQLSIFVVNDGSTDRTAQRVQEVAAADARVHLIDAESLPDGWTGKSHACWQGAAAAKGMRPQDDRCWLCFLDADTVSEAMLLRTAMHAADDRGLEFLSLEPFQELGSFWERLILPVGFFLVAFTGDVRQANDPASPEAHANGQFLLMRREAYEAAGTFAAVRSEIAEDSALARLVKQSGRRVAVVGTQDLIRTRMYRDFRSLWQGLSRQAGQLLECPGVCALVAAMALVLAWTALLLPASTLFNVMHHHATIANLVALMFAWAGSLALLGTHLGAARYFKIPFWYGLLFPIGYTLGAGIALNAAMGRLRGKVFWKGRSYAPAGTTRPASNDSNVAPASRL